MREFLSSRSSVVLASFLAASGFFLWLEHNAHIVSSLLPMILVGVCVVMHFFAHRGHDSSAAAADWVGTQPAGRHD